MLTLGPIGTSSLLFLPFRAVGTKSGCVISRVVWYTVCCIQYVV